MSLSLKGKLLLAGAGKMGGAMLAGWLDRGLAPSQIIVQDPAPPPENAELISRHGIEMRQPGAPLPEPPAPSSRSPWSPLLVVVSNNARTTIRVPDLASRYSCTTPTGTCRPVEDARDD